MATAFQHTSPPTLDPNRLPEVYAATGKGTCMQPLIADGTVLAFQKSAPVLPGDIVGIWFWPGHIPEGQPQQWIKRLVAGAVPIEAGASIVVEMLNPPRRFVLPRAHIQAIHKCLGPAQVQEDGRVSIRRSLIHPTGEEA